MKGRIIQPSVNMPAGSKHNPTQGYQRYMPLREFTGKDAQRQMHGPHVWHDFQTNRTYDAGPNWEQPPPRLPSGDPGGEPRCQPPSQAYRERYAWIDWRT
jgi:hypothetical protein